MNSMRNYFPFYYRKKKLDILEAACDDTIKSTILNFFYNEHSNKRNKNTFRLFVHTLAFRFWLSKNMAEIPRESLRSKIAGNYQFDIKLYYFR